MEILNTSSDLLNNIYTIAIGGFDGVHMAHQELIKRIGNGAVVVIENKYMNLTPNKNRLDYITNPILVFKLEDIKSLSGEEFIKKLKILMPNINKIVVGYDFHFGKNRAHDCNSLKDFFDGEVEIVDEIKYNGISVHSKTIREFIKDGKVDVASKFLAHNYKIKGVKTQGQGLGKKEFVPTINIICTDFLLPKEGVFATRCKIENMWYSSVSFIGHRVSTDGSFAIETHVFNYFGNKDESNIEIEFIEKIRENVKFDSFEALKRQIKDDLQVAKEVLNES